MNGNMTINLKKYIFLFITTFAFIFFGFHNFSNAKTIPISDANNLSNISIENKDILQFDNNVSSVDLSKLPKVDGNETKKIIIETKGETELKNKLPDKYELPLIISPSDKLPYGLGIPSTTSNYYIDNGTELNPNYLFLNSSEFDLSLLPAATDKTYLIVSDESEIDGIEFDGSLPENYVVPKIYINHEEDRGTFKEAFPNSDIIKKGEEKSSTTNDSSKNVNTSTLDTSDGSNNSTSTSNTNSDKSDSNKKTGDNLTNICLLGFYFLTFSSLSLIILFKRHKQN